MTSCVYCEQEKPLTREHILPSFIYKYQKSTGNSKLLEWREKPQKMVEGEAVIKDVCADCNNVTLSALDDHAKQILNKSGIFTPRFMKKAVDLEYNYDLLSRWLLKVSFNSSRASGIHEGVFKKYRELIINKSTDYSNFIIAAGLLKPLKLNEKERVAYGKDLDADEEGYANPFTARVSWEPQTYSRFSIKQIVIGAIIFHVVDFYDETPRNEKKELTKKYLNTFKGMSLIRKNDNKVEITQVPLTFIDSMRGHMLRPEVKPLMDKLVTRLESS